MWTARGTGWEAAAGARCRRGRAGACRAGTVQPAPRMCRTARAASVGCGAAVDGCRTRSAHGRVNGDLVWCGPRGAFGDCCSVCAGSVAPSGCPAQSSTVRSIRMTSTSTGRKTHPALCDASPPRLAARAGIAVLHSTRLLHARAAIAVYFAPNCKPLTFVHDEDLQARDPADRHCALVPQEQAAIGNRVASAECAAIPGMGALRCAQVSPTISHAICWLARSVSKAVCSPSCPDLAFLSMFRFRSPGPSRTFSSSAAHSAHKPLVVVLVHGGPIAIDALAGRPGVAILDALFPGQSGGQASERGTACVWATE